MTASGAARPTYPTPHERATEWVWLIQDGCSLNEVARWAGVHKSTVYRVVTEAGGRFADVRGYRCANCGVQVQRPRLAGKADTAHYCSLPACRAARERARAAARPRGTCQACGRAMYVRPRPDGGPQWCNEQACDRARQAWLRQHDPVYRQFMRDLARWQYHHRAGHDVGPPPSLAAYRRGERPVVPGVSDDRRRLPDARVAEILQAKGRLSGRKAAAVFGVGRSTVWAIWNGTRHTVPQEAFA